jgi:hypothetical protein
LTKGRGVRRESDGKREEMEAEAGEGRVKEQRQKDR